MHLLLQDLQLKNPWWSDSKYLIPESKWVKRNLVATLEENLRHPLIIDIVGLRRVGKSTILKQLIATLLDDGIVARNICYFLFDYASQIKSKEFLEEVLACYLAEILHTNVTQLTERIYIFLDEVQYLEDWQVVLKKYYDLSNKKIKFIISGSQSLLLKSKDKETLAGRIFDYYLTPLSFREFLLVNNIKIDFFPAFTLFELSKVFADLSSYDLHYGKKLKEFANKYIIAGQFPEVEQFLSLANKHEYVMESVLGKILEDCIRIFKIDKTNEFKLVAYHFLNNVGSIFELQNLSREIGISHLTLEKYLEYLQASYVLEILFKYHKSLSKRGRILKKVYATTVNFTCALQRYKESHLTNVPAAFGNIIENLIYNILAGKYRARDISNNLSFWRDGEKEIDFIVMHDEKILPVEVKFTNSITSKHLQVLLKYLKVKNLEYGVVVTKNFLDKKVINDKIIYFIPYHLMLFLI